MHRHLVAGYDGSPDARAASRWAAAEAVRRDVELLVVTSCSAPMVSAMSSGAGRTLSARALIERDRARGAVEAIVEELRGTHPGLVVSGHVLEGPPRRVLIEQAADAELLVVGIHGSGDDSHSPPATVARSLIHTSPCPVVLVPADGDPAGEVDGAPVLVAVDGTGKSVRALEWAVDAAVRRGAPLTIVHVWRQQAHDVGSEEYEITHARAARVLEDAMSHSQQRADVVVLQRLINGDAARDLPTVTKDAELVVVGSRVDHGLHVSTLGSVAEAVVAKARRPVAVVTASNTGGS